ncbi:Nramp family divalent metal transporter [Phaeodactylibacter sp.]|uniref:Nramp family divalent metal transporter n=1 Tax=Phaeodactylibacter sp. TaxID=1940289 RepID=UPI0025CE7B20|nr:Nramp family divalent metal transporter [Phaeodactylibacter sp.]MCI4648397.1 Nramp family divalent metal transporter [Phaeodactylibacter sp.]MCI5094133.1 Nramp family divalent metal transporter [Phaeodactylibacter sp.]
MVAAAFIGPGTVTTCTLAGVQSGYSLLWAMAFATLTTIVLQEMSARLGFVTQKGLGEALCRQFPRGINRVIVFLLVVGAIVIGNAAYEAGNITGGVLGMELLVMPSRFWALVIGGVSFLLLFLGKYRWVERVLIGLVAVMSICFLLTAILLKPDLGAIIRGFWPGSISERDWLLALAVVGTTVVPYNLFLHASTISKKWAPGMALKDVQMENAVSILLGGIVSMLIIITAASSASAVSEVQSAQDLAAQLEPVFGSGAKWLMGIGLMAAGISSALTAPLAAAYAACGLLGWPANEDDQRFRAVWMSILGIGVLVATMGFKPIQVIKFAQIANALLLPLIVLFLFYTVNQKEILGQYVNSRRSNALGLMVILVTIMLSVKVLWEGLGVW